MGIWNRRVELCANEKNARLSGPEIVQTVIRCLRRKRDKIPWKEEGEQKGGYRTNINDDWRARRANKSSAKSNNTTDVLAVSRRRVSQRELEPLTTNTSRNNEETDVNIKTSFCTHRGMRPKIEPITSSKP